MATKEKPMQEKRYYSDALASYIILECPENAREDYQYRMLAVNRIEGLLPCKHRVIDGEEFLYYNITSRQSIARLYDHRKLDGEQLRQLLYSVAGMVQTLSSYLLDPDRLLLNPENIFYDYEEERYCFTYYPEENRRQDYEVLFAYLEDRVADGEETGRIVIYRLCELAVNEGFLLKPELLDHEYAQAGGQRERYVHRETVPEAAFGRARERDEQGKWGEDENEEEEDDMDELLENDREMRGSRESSGKKRERHGKTRRGKRLHEGKNKEQQDKGKFTAMVVLSVLLAGGGIGMYAAAAVVVLLPEQLFALRSGTVFCLIMAIVTAVWGIIGTWKRNRREIEQEERAQQEERRNAMMRTTEA